MSKSAFARVLWCCGFVLLWQGGCTRINNRFSNASTVGTSQQNASSSTVDATGLEHIPYVGVRHADHRSEWNLAELYDAPTDTRIASTKNTVEKLARRFATSYKNRVSITNLMNAIDGYELIIKTCGKISLYANLYAATRQNSDDALVFQQTLEEWIADINKSIVFFELEIAKLDPKALAVAIERDPRLAKYETWIKSIIKNKKHDLSTAIEEILTQKNLVAENAQQKFHRELLTRIKIDFEGIMMGLPQVLSISGESSNSLLREKAFRGIAKKLEQENFYLKHIYNSILLNRCIETSLRNYDLPESFRHIFNDIDQRTVDALTTSVVNSYPNISHRYYRLKAKLMGKEKLEYWDRNAPVNLTNILNRKFSYRKAIEIVKCVFQSFSDEFGNIASSFIDNGWIDVYARNGKISGAFTICNGSEHPYILLNYMGSLNDVSTLAHELGHGIHNSLSLKNGPLLMQIPIALQETASLFAENLLFDEIYKSAKTNREKIDLLCKKIEKVINSSLRQIAFFEFEREVHDLRRRKELTCYDFSRLYLKNLRKYLGDAVNVDSCVGNSWSCVHHFFESPFYVYSYAFGELLTTALYKSYLGTTPDFREKYVSALSQGSIDRCDVMTKKFGLDINSQRFWSNCLKLIEENVDELERLCRAEGYYLRN
ncbi:MAG: M3 family oligoendopeptidase [Holosporaceae bacterium]|jgi:oligoendopeptidase F|nr:M3 family oligoendopeptidase [Holosporaceae bacterium]